MSVRKTRLRAISPNDKLIIDDETGMVVGIAPDARTPASRLMVMDNDLTLSAATRAELAGAGLLVADESGNFIANIGHRRGLFANLITLSGEPGEISIPTDVDGFVIHNGVANQAKFFRRLDNDNTAGADSLAIGLGASTANTAAKSLALGAGAQTTVAGEVCFGSAKPGVRTARFTGYAETDSASAKIVTADGTVNAGAIQLPNLMGIYDLTITFLAREGWTDNWARFVRRCVLVVNEDYFTTTVSNVTTPTPDVNSGLAGCAVAVAGFGGRLLNTTVTGLAGRTINWSMFVEANAMTEQVIAV